MGKVKFNLKNVHYAVLQDEATPTWDVPKAVPGAVSLSVEPEGEVSPFYADGILYYQSIANNGYTGELEIALLPPEFLKDVFGYTEGSTSKVLTENAGVEPKAFALMCEEDGNVDGTKFVFYKCSATRPTREFKTKTNTKEPTTQKLSITISPMADGKVFAMTQETTTSEIDKAWYTSVYVEKESMA